MGNRDIAIMIYDAADVLDIFGPIEVFVLAGYNCFLVSSDNNKEITLSGGIKVITSNKSLYDKFDLLVIPGGPGLNKLLKNNDLIENLKERILAKNFRKLASICAGALFFSAIGILDGRKATTHWASKKILKINSKITVVNDRVVKDNDIYTSSGITAGIDLALTIVEEWDGIEVRKEIELLTEYKKNKISFENDFIQNEYQSSKNKIKAKLSEIIKERFEIIESYNRT